MMPQSSNLQRFDWRENRRLRAFALHQQGWIQRQIAQELGVSQSSVSRWLKRVRQSGSVAALHRHPAPGQQSRLTDEQFAQIPELIARGPEAFGFRGSQWTTKRVASALKQVFGVSYHPGHVSRLLQKYCPEWREQKQK